MKLPAILALFACLCACLCTSSAIASTRFALVVGQNLGDANEVPLRWAESDAERVHEVLTALGDVSTERAKLVLAPGLIELEDALLELKGRLAEARSRGEHTALFFYYSGHADADHLHLGRELVAIAKLREDLAALDAAVVVAIVDACRNDRAPRSREKGARRAPGFEWPRDVSGRREGFAFLTSAARGEVAQESDDIQGSLFTSHLLAGVAGAADSDDDGLVTLEELYGYSHSRTLEETHGKTTAVQHSELDVALSGQGPLVITYPRRAAARLELDATLRGSVLVVDDATGRIAAELVHPGGRELRIAIAPGRYRVQVRDGDDVRAALVSIAPPSTRVTREQLTKQDAIATARKGTEFDPYPLIVRAELGARTPTVDAFSAAPVLTLAVHHRAFDAWRLGGDIDIALGFANSPLWDRNNTELAVSAAADVVLPLAPFALTLGPRAGALIVVQQGVRRDAERLKAVLGNDAATHELAAALGPRAGVVLGVELALGSRADARIAAEGAAALLPVGDALALSASGAVRAGVQVRF